MSERNIEFVCTGFDVVSQRAMDAALDALAGLVGLAPAPWPAL